ncbi:hypothetical protein Bca101_029575 [Brassica carinata]
MLNPQSPSSVSSNSVIYSEAPMEEEKATTSSLSTRLRNRKHRSTEAVVIDGDKVSASPLLVNDLNKYKSFMVRTYSTLWKISGFVLVVYMGHLYITGHGSRYPQIFMAKELFNLLRKAPEDNVSPGPNTSIGTSFSPPCFSYMAGSLVNG